MLNPEYYKLGQKIRNFRKRANKSQMDLELEIGASPGSLSRIENGEVNPTKETLVKIIEVLKLQNIEAATLFNLDLKELPNVVRLARKVSSNLDLDKLLQDAVNDIAFELNLLGVVICLKHGNFLYAKTFTQSWYTRLVLNIIQTDFNKLYLDITTPQAQSNKFLEVISTGKPLISERLSDFSSPPLPKALADLSQKVSGHVCAIGLPLIADKQVVGVIMFTKGYVDDFKNELPILEAFSEHVATAVVNAQKYEKLIMKLEKIKKEKNDK
ncbi:MAG: helix-turn-helix domain-containing protein [Candidatus Dojkabacteria bacterium]